MMGMGLIEKKDTPFKKKKKKKNLTTPCLVLSLISPRRRQAPRSKRISMELPRPAPPFQRPLDLAAFLADPASSRADRLIAVHSLNTHFLALRNLIEARELAVAIVSDELRALVERVWGFIFLFKIYIMDMLENEAV
jgi:hypothetical protein